MATSPRLRKDIERSVKVNEFQNDVDRLLTAEDKDYLMYALKEFSTYKNVPVLIQALKSCLDSPEKLDLLPVIRDLLPKPDQREFDVVAPYKKMAHPNAAKKLASRRKSAKNLRTVWLERANSEPLGASIRGGKEMGLGIYISKVEFDSPADKSGLEVGDQIVEVNGINFEWVTHKSAVMVMKAFDDLCIVIRSAGKLPKLEGKSYTWVDALGRPVEEDSPHNDDVYRRDSDLQLLSSVDKRRLVIQKDPTKSLGLRIRGGREYRLGIYVVGVDPGSLAELYGLVTGDQILLVNGHSFRNILHEEAVAVLRNSPVLIMTVKSVGKIPKISENVKSKLREEKDKPVTNEVGPKKENTDGEDDSDIARSSTVPNLSELQPSSVSPSSSPPSRLRSNSLRAAGKTSPTGSHKGIKCLNRDSFRSNGASPMLHRSNPRPTSNSVSPLVVAHQKPPEHLQSDEFKDDTPFEYGLGTQVMLSSMQTPARGMLVNQARRLLTEDEVTRLEELLDNYDETKKVKKLANFLIHVLDTPEKYELVRDVRSVLIPAHISEFDKLVSPHELAAIKEKSGSLDDLPPKRGLTSTIRRYDEVISAIQNQPKALHRVKFAGVETELKSISSPELGFFKNQTAHQLVDKARDLKEPLTLSPQSRDSFLAWNEDYHEREKVPFSSEPPMSNKPVHLELNKISITLGLILDGGDGESVMVIDVEEESMAYKDGFIKPGFLILECEGQTLDGMGLQEVEHMLNEAYNSDCSTIELVVLPPPV